MARVAPAPGTTIEERILTRAIPDAVPEQSDDRDFWEVQSSLSPAQWTGDGKPGSGRMVYVYRRVGDRLGAYIAKYPHAISEDMIAENHGGGMYRCFLKNSSGMILKTANFEIEGAAKINTGAPVATQPAHSNGSVDANSINRLCDLLERVVLKDNGSAVQSEALRAALNLQSEGFRSVVTNVRDIAPPAAPSNPMDDITRQFLQAAITKMLNPSDPIETFAKMMAAMKGLGFDAGASRSSIGAELVRTVGGAIPQIVDGVKSYTNAVGKQAELEIVRITHGLNRPLTPGPAQPPQPLPAQPAAQPVQPSQPQPGSAQAVVTFDDIEKHIAYLMTRPELSVSDAAQKILDYCQDISPDRLYPYICSLDEPTLTAFINSRPILSQVPKDPRFSEIIKKIVELTTPDPADTSNTSPQTPPAS